MEPDHLNTYNIAGKGWIRIPDSPLEIRIEWHHPYGSFDIRWNPEEDFFGALRRDAHSSPS